MCTFLTKIECVYANKEIKSQLSFAIFRFFFFLLLKNTKMKNILQHKNSQALGTMHA